MIRAVLENLSLILHIDYMLSISRSVFGIGSMAPTVQKDKGRKKMFTKVKSLTHLLVLEVDTIRIKWVLYLDILAEAS